MHGRNIPVLYHYQRWNINYGLGDLVLVSDGNSKIRIENTGW